MLKTLRWLAWPAALMLVLAAPSLVGAQGNPDPTSFKFNNGQDVVPVFEGWARNADGSYAMWFGYFNRNYAETPVIPVGPENKIEPGAADRGQPTFFYTRTHRMGFSVNVPSDWGKKELTWTLTVHGKTEKAVAWLQPEWEIDPVFGGKYQSPEAQKNTGADIGAEGAVNGQRVQTVDADGLDHRRWPSGPQTTAKDRRRPGDAADAGGAARAKSRFRSTSRRSERRGRGGRGRGGEPQQGVIVTWTVWRGPANVTFAPALQRVVKSGDAVVTATFEKPGTYVLRAKANDTHRFVEKDVTVTVTAQ